MNLDYIEGLNEEELLDLYDETLLSCYCYCDNTDYYAGEGSFNNMCDNTSACKTNCVSMCSSKRGAGYSLNRCKCINTGYLTGGWETLCWK